MRHFILMNIFDKLSGAIVKNKRKRSDQVQWPTAIKKIYKSFDEKGTRFIFANKHLNHERIATQATKS